MHLAEFALFAGLSWTLPVDWQSPPEPPSLRCPAPPGLAAASGATVVMVGSTTDIAPRDLARLPDRAGLGFLGYRVSFRVFARAGASASDVAWAEVSARSAGFSPIGRE